MYKYDSSEVELLFPMSLLDDELISIYVSWNSVWIVIRGMHNQMHITGSPPQQTADSVAEQRQMRTPPIKFVYCRCTLKPNISHLCSNSRLGKGIFYLA